MSDRQLGKLRGMPRAADRMVRGQPYWLLGEADHVTQDGHDVKLDVWASCCAECGQPFVFRAFRPSNGLNRRCKAHHAHRRV